MARRQHHHLVGLQQRFEPRGRGRLARFDETEVEALLGQPLFQQWRFLRREATRPRMRKP
jgi:hypothetical protein